jgi:hypothetical protein
MGPGLERIWSCRAPSQLSARRETGASHLAFFLALHSHLLLARIVGPETEESCFSTPRCFPSVRCGAKRLRLLVPQFAHEEPASTRPRYADRELYRSRNCATQPAASRADCDQNVSPSFLSGNEYTCGSHANGTPCRSLDEIAKRQAGQAW